MTTLRFDKMHALCNDFMVVNAVDTSFKPTPLWIQSVAHRRSGVGFDQLLVVENSESSEVDFNLSIYNSDGGEAEQCGNGTACVLMFLRNHDLTQNSVVTLNTGGGTLEASLVEVESKGNHIVQLRLAEPSTDPARVPFKTTKSSMTHDLDLIDESIGVVSVTPISIGNPHAVVFDFEVGDERLPRIGQSIQLHEQFPESANVEFVEVVSPSELKIRIIERGAGETMACGSGSCAATSAAYLLGHVEEKVTVNQPGGSSRVEWKGKGNPIYLTVPASHIYSGEVDIA